MQYCNFAFKMGAKFYPKIIDNQAPALTKRENKFSVDFVISTKSTWPVFSGSNCYMIVLLYDKKFRITSFVMIKPSPCVLFFPMYYLVSTQKTKANLQTFQFHNGTCTSTTDVAKYYYIVCNMLNLNFCNCSFPLWKKCFCLN